MKKLLIGMVIGGVLASAMIFTIIPQRMVSEIPSPLGYEATLANIQHTVTNAGWKVSAVMRLDKSLAKEGKTVLPAASLKICQPDYAEKVLNDDAARFVSVMMPCSIAVYEKADGITYISTMNTKLLGRMFGGTVAEVMAGPVAEETATFIQFEQ
ncbi:MAG TPA: DUF302 domain-containing protein [Pontiella sp.]|nr:DUF302 domain-containing protein [Pontiella sp.]